MAWSQRLTVGGDTFDVTYGYLLPDLTPDTAARLSLSVAQIQALGPEGVQRVAAWFEEEGAAWAEAVDTLLVAERYGYAEGCVPDDDLRLIIDSPYLSADEKAPALAAQEQREIARAEREARRKPPRAPRPGSVYFLRAEDGSGLYKIGVTQAVGARIGQLCTKLPFATTLVGTLASPDAWALEARLHREHAAARVHGEWFRLTEGQVRDLLAGAPP